MNKKEENTCRDCNSPLYVEGDSGCHYFACKKCKRASDPKEWLNLSTNTEEL